MLLLVVVSTVFMGCGLVAKYSLLEGNRQGLLAVQLCALCRQSEKHKISFYQGERPLLLLALDHVVTFQKWYIVLPI